ncbi:MAG TPA: serine/threonine-protein kinase, partial [Gemmataceae bacterium]|nr:serine/threonine-protein kinase [Gemmataceae bacterium]
LVHGTICWRDPDVSREDAFWYMLVVFGAVSFSWAMVFFCAHRFERLHRAAVAARRLGQYQLKELLGRGGMGEVYRAEPLLLRRPCAVKLIRSERAGDPQTLRRFEREVQATATLTNWHSVEIFDYGHAADGTFYYVMEYLPGLTLDQLVAGYGPLPPGRAVHLLRQVCAALREAHAIGLIHRDIKPGNVIVGERGGLSDVAKLLDFGLVRPAGLDPKGEKLTQTGAVVGTPAYVSPEQAGDGEVDARSDVYSLGAVAYCLLAGRPPFVGKSALHVLAAHLREEVRPLTDYRGDCPADLEAVVMRCLEKEPERRCATIDALDEALTRCACAADWDGARAAAWWRDHGRNKGKEGP